MWLTSKTPTPVRTAICSATMPHPIEAGYSTGISHPPKSTILAPKRRCAELSAVLRSCVVVGTVTGLLEKEICSKNMANSERNTRPRTESRKPPFRAYRGRGRQTQVRTCMARARAETRGKSVLSRLAVSLIFGTKWKPPFAGCATSRRASANATVTAASAWDNRVSDYAATDCTIARIAARRARLAWWNAPSHESAQLLLPSPKPLQDCCHALDARQLLPPRGLTPRAK